MPTSPAGVASTGSKKKRGGISDDDYFEPDEEELEEERECIYAKLSYIVVPAPLPVSTALCVVGSTFYHEIGSTHVTCRGAW